MELERLPKTETLHVRVLALLVALACVFCLTLLSGCQDEGSDDTESQETETEQAEQTEEEQPAYLPHGSAYGKTETVAVTTDLEGNLKALSVDDWLKNPGELAEMSDVSVLDNIAAEEEGVGFTQDGTKLTWTTGGQDIHYSGTTSQELPFAITYGFTLDGTPVKPEELKNVTGKLEIHISYEIKRAGTLENGSKVTHPYVFASLVAFDAEHATNIDVNNGTTLDQDGTTIAAGVAMPGLAKTLELEDQLDLPTSVTITADVKGFDMVNITTMVTDQALNAFDESSTADLEESIDDMFSSLDNIKKATDGLSQGSEGISAALDKIAAGQKSMADAIPNAGDGLEKLSGVAGQLEDVVEGAGKAVEVSSAQQGTALEQLQTALETLPEDAEGRAQVEAAIAALKQADAANTQASQALAGANQMAEGLNSGLSGATEGIAQMQEGAQNLSTALSQVNEASSKLSQGAATLNKGVKEALSSARSTIDSKLDLIDALRAYVQNQGAWAGSDSAMDASTTFIVKAEA